MRRSFEVPNRPLEAFAFVRDFEHAAAWDPAVTSAERIDPGPVHIGTRFVLVAKPFSMRMPYQVVDLEQGRRIALEGQNDDFAWRDEITFDPIPNGGTIITYDARLDLKGLLGVGQPVLYFAFRRAGNQAIDGIKRLLTERWEQGQRARTPMKGDGAPPVPPSEVERIVAMDDQPELRNLLITQGYHDIGVHLARFVGRDDANWCTFGAWASRTAGRFIRNEEVPSLLRDVLAKHAAVDHHRKLATAAGHPDLFDSADAIIADVQRYILTGNKVVFAELALAFSRFLEAVGKHERRDDAALEALLAAMPDGPSLPDRVTRGPGGTLVVQSQGGQSVLKASLRYYYEAKWEKDETRKAQLVLLASAYGGIHEQTRLQPYIAGSLDAPIDDVLGEFFGASQPSGSPASSTWGKIGALFTSIVAAVKDAWEGFSTEALMVLKLPDGTVKLGFDLGRAPGFPLYPASLVTITDPELVALLASYGITGDSGHALDWLGGAAHSAARNWVNLSQRLRYIFTLFRSRQEDDNLWLPPFTDEQTREIRAGRVPKGPLY
jgi:hypothetical protein